MNLETAVVGFCIHGDNEKKVSNSCVPSPTMRLSWYLARPKPHSRLIITILFILAVFAKTVSNSSRGFGRGRYRSWVGAIKILYTQEIEKIKNHGALNLLCAKISDTK